MVANSYKILLGSYCENCLLWQWRKFLSEHIFHNLVLLFVRNVFADCFPKHLLLFSELNFIKEIGKQTPIIRVSQNVECTINYSEWERGKRVFRETLDLRNSLEKTIKQSRRKKTALKVSSFQRSYPKFVSVF